jgi:hypothetical protein
MFVNLTPHTLNVYSHNPSDPIFEIEPSGQVARVSVQYTIKAHVIDISDPILEIEPSGQVARVSGQYTIKAHVIDIPVYDAKYGEVEGLPEPEDGVFYIVSGMVKAAVPDREDVFSPGELIRDENGRPIGCRGLKA